MPESPYSGTPTNYQKESTQSKANEIFKSKYSTRKESTELEDLWGDYSFLGMNRLIDAYFVGGFGSLKWINMEEYKRAALDVITHLADDRNILDTLAQLNARYSGELMQLVENGCDDLWIISIDKFGMEVCYRCHGSSYITRKEVSRRRYNISRGLRSLRRYY